MRLPEDLAESMLEQAYANRPHELIAWALGYACRILEAFTDEETAMRFNKDSSSLLMDAIKSYQTQKGTKESSTATSNSNMEG